MKIILKDGTTIEIDDSKKIPLIHIVYKDSGFYVNIEHLCKYVFEGMDKETDEQYPNRKRIISKNTVEDKVKFVRRYISLFSAYSNISGYPQNASKVVQRIAEKARKELHYSPKTSSCDLVHSLAKIYFNIKKK